MILEPVAAGLFVALVNKFVIINAWLWEQWGCQESEDREEDGASSTSTATSDAVHH